MIEQLFNIGRSWTLPGPGALAVAILLTALVVVIGWGYQKWGRRP